MRKVLSLLLQMLMAGNCFGLVICINIPNDQSNRVIDAVTSIKKYRVQVEDTNNTGSFITNPESKAQFTKRVLVEFLKDHVSSYEGNRDANLARIRAIQKVNSEINIQ